MTPLIAHDRPVTLDDIVSTVKISQRSVRQPDYPAEINALHALAQRLVDAPDTMLDTLMALALRLCDAGTAGLSLLDADDAGQPVFRWVALGGALASYVGGTTPRDFSPCGTCLDRRAPQLYSYPERHFTYFAEARPAIVEGLVIPIWWKGEALGTIWIVSHDERRQFDREDVRVMESLASFTAAALSVQQLRRDAEQHRVQLQQRVSERTAELTESHARLASALAECRSLESARSEWLRTLMNAQEDERRRLARELHDEMGQHLTGLTLGLQALANGNAEDRGATGRRLQEAVARIDRGIHRLARALRPAELDDLGLVSALGALIAEWSQTSGVTCDFSSRDGLGRLAEPTENTVYRIAQEALTNVARHAGASHASVVIDRSRNRVQLIVEDDGVGFDVAVGNGPGSARLGLTGIRERAALLGGTVTVESSPAGTAMFVTLPLDGSGDE